MPKFDLYSDEPTGLTEPSFASTGKFDLFSTETEDVSTLPPTVPIHSREAGWTNLPGNFLDELQHEVIPGWGAMLQPLATASWGALTGDMATMASAGGEMAHFAKNMATGFIPAVAQDIYDLYQDPLGELQRNPFKTISTLGLAAGPGGLVKGAARAGWKAGLLEGSQAARAIDIGTKMQPMHWLEQGYDAFKATNPVAKSLAESKQALRTMRDPRSRMAERTVTEAEEWSKQLTPLTDWEKENFWKGVEGRIPASHFSPDAHKIMDEYAAQTMQLESDVAKLLHPNDPLRAAARWRAWYTNHYAPMTRELRDIVASAPATYFPSFQKSTDLTKAMVRDYFSFRKMYNEMAAAGTPIQTYQDVINAFQARNGVSLSVMRAKHIHNTMAKHGNDLESLTIGLREPTYWPHRIPKGDADTYFGKEWSWEPSMVSALKSRKYKIPESEIDPDPIRAMIQHRKDLYWWMGREQAIQKLQQEGLAIPAPKAASGVLQQTVDEAFKKNLKAKTGQDWHIEPQRRFAMPQQVHDTIMAEMRLGSRGNAARAVDSALSAWRHIVLPWNPRWLVGNVTGSGGLAAAAIGIPYNKYAKHVMPGKATTWVHQSGPLKGQSLVPPNVMMGVTREVLDDAAREALEIYRPNLPEWASYARDKIAGATPAWGKEAASKVAGTYQAVTKNIFEVNALSDDVFRSAVLASKTQDLAELSMMRQNLKFNPADLETHMQKILADPKTRQVAIDFMHKWMGNYADLRPIEKSLVKRVFTPFWAWWKSMAKLAVRLPAEDPLKAKLILLADRVAQEEDPTMNDPTVPEWARKGKFWDEVVREEPPWGQVKRTRRLSVEGLVPYQSLGYGLPLGPHVGLAAGAYYGINPWGERVEPPDTTAEGGELFTLEKDEKGNPRLRLMTGGEAFKARAQDQVKNFIRGLPIEAIFDAFIRGGRGAPYDPLNPFGSKILGAKPRSMEQTRWEAIIERSLGISMREYSQFITPTTQKRYRRILGGLMRRHALQQQGMTEGGIRDMIDLFGGSPEKKQQITDFFLRNPEQVNPFIDYIGEVNYANE